MYDAFDKTKLSYGCRYTCYLANSVYKLPVDSASQNRLCRTPWHVCSPHKLDRRALWGSMSLNVAGYLWLWDRAYFVFPQSISNFWIMPRFLANYFSTRLGDYEAGHFSDQRALKPLGKFQEAIEGIEAEIEYEWVCKLVESKITNILLIYVP